VNTFSTRSASVLWILAQLPPGTPDWVASLILDHHVQDWELPNCAGYHVPPDCDLAAACAAIRRTITQSPYQPIP
jgi:hypothetical protein